MVPRIQTRRAYVHMTNSATHTLFMTSVAQQFYGAQHPGPKPAAEAKCDDNVLAKRMYVDNKSTCRPRTGRMCRPDVRKSINYGLWPVKSKAKRWPCTGPDRLRLKSFPRNLSVPLGVGKESADEGLRRIRVAFFIHS